MQAKYKKLRDDAYERGAAELEELLPLPTFIDFVVLFITEGHKRARNALSIANSDPAVIALVDRWCRRLADKEPIYSVQHHADQALEDLRCFWGSLLNVEPDVIRFQRKSNSNQLAKRTWRSPHGVLTVTVNDTYLRARMPAWVDHVKQCWLDSNRPRGVAKPGIAPALGAGDRWFESSRPDLPSVATTDSTPESTTQARSGGRSSLKVMPAPEASTSTSTITVILADDHEIVRDGIRMVLEAEEDIAVVAEAGDTASAVRYVLGHKPTVLVLDLNMPGGSSLEAIPTILESSPETSVVMLTMQSDEAFAREALGAGAKGYVVKHAAASELVDAIRAVVAGQTYVNPQMGAKLAAAPPPGESAPDGLTPRELEILGLLADGLMNPEIAEKLVLSVRTVETHRANIQRKTSAKTRAELIAYAREHDLVQA